MTNKVCVIIGGGSGMGAAVAKEMNKRNYNLALMSPSKIAKYLLMNSEVYRYVVKQRTPQIYRNYSTPPWKNMDVLIAC